MTNVIQLDAVASPLRILVVDDHLDGLHALVKLLETHGHVVAFAINGFAALETAREFKPNVVILDLRLPDMSGLDVARQLKFEPGLEGVRLIALTGSPELRQKAAEHGITEFVVKPADPGIWRRLFDAGSAEQGSGNVAGR